MQDEFPPRHHFERPPYPPHHFDYPQGDFPGGEIHKTTTVTFLHLADVFYPKWLMYVYDKKIIINFDSKEDFK